MYLIEVIPIARGISREALSYYSASDITAGSLVSVPIRKRLLPALVISSRSAVDEKASIRSSGFSLKKVEKFKSKSFLSEAYIKAARSTADYSASTLGGVLSLLIPKVIMESLPNMQPAIQDDARVGTFDRLALQADDDERFAAYRSLIREEFARKRSVFFCIPTAEDVKRFTEILPKGITDFTYSLYSSLPKKKIRDVWEKASAETHPILIIATAPFLAIRRLDLGTIVIEDESSRSYKLPVRPYLDVRTFAEFFAKETGAKLLVGDTFLRTETIYRVKHGEFAEFAPLKFRSLTSAEIGIVDMSAYKKSTGGKFETISAELEALINRSHTDNQNLFIFSARRGFAPQTLCGDCGTIVQCSKCHSPITLHTATAGDGSKNFFYCHSCGEKRSAEEHCSKCGSWKLQPLGIGIELVETELHRKFPDLKIFRVDRDKTSTPKRIIKEVTSFYSSPGSILLGTEMALPYLDKKVENTAVASLDSLFSLPDFRIHEKILHLLLKVRSITGSTCIIQTRIPNERVLEYATKGNLIDFYRDEIKARESFEYPPFTTLIKITLSGTKVAVAREMDKLKVFLEPFTAEIFSAFIEEARGVTSMHALLRLKSGDWINKDLLQKLLTLPSQFRIAVDPESLL